MKRKPIRSRTSGDARATEGDAGATEGGAGATDRRPAGGVAFLVVNSRGGVESATAWEEVVGGRPPARIPAPAGARTPLTTALASAVKEAGETGVPVRRIASLGESRAGSCAIIAGVLGAGRANRRTAVIVDARHGGAGTATVEGQTIRRLGHDLRSPLTSISGATELLQSGRLGSLTEQQNKCLSMLQRGIDSLLEKIETATAPYRPTAAELVAIGLEDAASGGGATGR